MLHFYVSLLLLCASGAYASNPCSPNGACAYDSVRRAIPGTIVILEHDTGGLGIGYNSSSVLFEPSASLVAQQAYGWRAGDWLQYSVAVQQTSTYRVTLYGANARVHLELGAAVRMQQPFVLASTGSRQAYTNVSSTFLLLPYGVFALRVVFDADALLSSTLCALTLAATDPLLDMYVAPAPPTQPPTAPPTQAPAIVLSSAPPDTTALQQTLPSAARLNVSTDTDTPSMTTPDTPTLMPTDTPTRASTQPAAPTDTPTRAALSAAPRARVSWLLYCFYCCILLL